MQGFRNRGRRQAMVIDFGRLARSTGARFWSPCHLEFVADVGSRYIPPQVVKRFVIRRFWHGQNFLTFIFKHHFLAFQHFEKDRGLLWKTDPVVIQFHSFEGDWDRHFKIRHLWRLCLANQKQWLYMYLRLFNSSWIISLILNCFHINCKIPLPNDL